MLEITLEDVKRINKRCLKPGEPFEVLDESRIESAIGNQFQPYELDEQAASSVYKSLVINHGFANGNKRTAVLVLLLFADSIGKELKCSHDELNNLTYRIASEGGSMVSVNEITNKLFGLKLDEDVEDLEGDDLEVSDEQVELSAVDIDKLEAQAMAGAEAYQQERRLDAERCGATLKFYKNVSPQRLTGVWYDTGYTIASLRYKDYVINIFTGNEWELSGGGENIFVAEDLKKLGIFTDSDLRTANDQGTIEWVDDAYIEFVIGKADANGELDFDHNREWIVYGCDLEKYENFDNLNEAFDFDFYIDVIIREYQDYLADYRDVDLKGIKFESLGKPSKNDLKKSAKRHKRTDKKGARGWFVNPNAGNVEYNIAHFNHIANGGPLAQVSAAGPAGGGGLAPAGLGEDLEDDELEVSDEPVELRTPRPILIFNPLVRYRKIVYGRGYGRYGSRYPEVVIPETALKVSKNDYKNNPIVANNKNVLKGIENFFNINKRSKFCVVEYKVARGGRYVRADIFSKLTKNAKPILTAADAQRVADLIKPDRYGRIIFETIERHETLNPKLWEGTELKPEVGEKVKQIVNEFVETLKQDKIKINVDDVVLIGSNCSYNYNDSSDLDIHIKCNMDSLECPDNLYPLLYSAYRSIFNKKYEIDFYGIGVELYIDAEDTTTVSNGIYSLSKGWIKEPVKEDIPEVDQEKFDSVFTKWEDRYFDIIGNEEVPEEKPIEPVVESIESDRVNMIDDFLEDLYDLRKLSLKKDGEYSTGNLVFKEMRSLGYLDNLKSLKAKLKSKELSLEGLELDEAKRITRYAYEGPVFRFSRIVIEKANLVTTANSPREAIRDIKAQAAKKLGLDISSGINIEINAQDVYPIEAVGDTEDTKPQSCEKCHGKLNDAGECPNCDLGDASALDEELNTSKINTLDKLNKLSQEVDEDGTYSSDEDGKLTKVDLTTGKQVSFFRPEIKDEDIQLVLKAIGNSFGEPYLGFYDGRAEISYTLESSIAKEVARIFNQKSVWDNELKSEEANMSYDENAKVDYVKASESLSELIGK